jgi:hypothetical protein
MGLREMFGPSREEVWRRLGQEVGGDFVAGGFWKGDKVEVQHGSWTITLDRYTVSTGHTHAVFTRMRAPFVSRDGFRFNIYRRGFWSEIGKKLGMQDIEVGHSVKFDEDFVIKANDESKVKALLANPEIRRLLNEQPRVRFELKDDENPFWKRFPEGVDELCFTIHGVVKDVDRLRKLFDLFAEVLDELCRIGSATAENPGVKL